MTHPKTQLFRKIQKTNSLMAEHRILVQILGRIQTFFFSNKEKIFDFTGCFSTEVTIFQEKENVPKRMRNPILVHILFH